MAETSERVRDLAARGRWDAATELLRRGNPGEAAEEMLALPFEQQRLLFRHLPADMAATLTAYFPYFHTYVLLYSLTAPEIAAVVDAMSSTERNAFLDALPEESWQTLMKTLEEAGLAALPPVGTAIQASAAGPAVGPAEVPSEESVGEPGTVLPQPEPCAATAQAPAAETSPASLPEESQAIVEARQVTKAYAQPEGREIQVVAPINLSVEPNKILALLGPSGSGKLTILRMLSGLLAPTSGEVLWHGRPLSESRPNVAIVFQSFALFPWLTVVENVEAPLIARGMEHPERHTRALKALDAVGLMGFETAYPKELSGGMKQRVGFARALAVEPEILFMDEPFSALDVLTAENLRKELLELWTEKKVSTRSIFIVTHNIEEAVLLADRVVVLGANPATIRADFCIPLGQPRDRKSASFLLYVDYIYKVMTQPRLELAPPTPGQAGSKPQWQALPHTRPGSIAGLLELVVDHGGEEDLYHVAEQLLLEVDDLLPIVEGATLLGFANAREGDVKATPEGRAFAEADIATRKSLFRDAALGRVELLQKIKSALESKSDHVMPIEFFHDILDEHFIEEEVKNQLDTVVNWGRYAGIFTYNPARGTLRLQQAGKRATAGGSESIQDRE